MFKTLTTVSSIVLYVASHFSETTLVKSLALLSAAYAANLYFISPTVAACQKYSDLSF